MRKSIIEKYKLDPAFWMFRAEHISEKDWRKKAEENHRRIVARFPSGKPNTVNGKMRMGVERRQDA
jgi:hypothetical protein